MARIKYAFILLLVMATLHNINCQLAAISISLPQIISLLENTTEISRYMPHFAALMKDQKAEQVSTNAILVNNTASVLRVISLMDEQQCEIQEKQNQFITLLKNQENIQNQTAGNQDEMTITLKEIATILSQMASTQIEMSTAQTQMANSLTEIQSTQNSIPSTQTQMAHSLTEIQSTQNSIASTQTQMAHSLTEIQSTQNSIAITQTQMATTMNQMVSLLQRHEEQLENVTTIMISMIEQNTHNQMNTSLSQIQTERLPLTASDCPDILDQGFNNGLSIYTIKPPDNLVSFLVSCDLLTEGGKWIVFQRRFDGSVNFYRGWDDYKNGFGELDGEYWLGLEKIHRLTSNGVWQLRIELEDFYGNTAYAQYDNFVIGNETTYYRLGLGAYNGTAGDSFTRHANSGFTTYDQANDHDGYSGNCAQHHQGAWWYFGCHYSNLNGLYVGSPVNTWDGMVWKHWKNSWEVLKKSEMKMRCTQ